MSFQPPNYTYSVVSLQANTGKSCLCKRLIDSNWDNYQTFLVERSTKRTTNTSKWIYWGSIKHRRLDGKREGIFHFIEHSSIPDDEDQEDSFDFHLKRLTNLTLRSDEKPKDKLTIDGFLCIYDLSTNEPMPPFLSLLHLALKTRRPVLVITTKNDRISFDEQTKLSFEFERIIHGTFAHLPIVHTSSDEHVNIQSVLELALYASDDWSRKTLTSKYQAPSYSEAWKNEQSLKHVIQTEYRALFNRHVPDGRTGGSWEKFYDRWQHHTSVQTFIDMFGKEQAQLLYREHLDECQRVQRQKLLDERFIPIIELLLNDSKGKISRNWDYVRLQMQQHPRYSSTVISTKSWSDFERNNPNSLAIPEDLLQTNEVRLRFETYLNQRQIEQTRRFHSRAFFELLSRFADAGLVHYGDSYDKDSVYFLGRECFEALNNSDRLKIFSLHQSYLYRLLCLQFVELLLESLEIFLQTFEKMNFATKFSDESTTTIQRRKNLTIDEIFQKEILEEIKHDSRYRALNKRETDRHRLIMCHCHFLYDSIYYPSRWIRRHHRSWKRRKSSSLSSNSNLNIEEHFCPYTRKDQEKSSKKKLDIACPMENDCADARIYHELFVKFKLKPMKKNILICGNENEVSEILQIYSNDVYLTNDFPINPIGFHQYQNETIDGCLLVCEKAQEMFESLNSNSFVPFAHLTDFDDEEHSSENIPIERLRCALENLFSSIETNRSNEIHVDLKVLLVFMCGGEKNDVETFLTHLSHRFTLIGTRQSSFMIHLNIGRVQRKIEFVCVSFHSIFAWKFDEFNGFFLFYDRDRKAAVQTMTYLEKFINDVFVKQRRDTDEIRRRPIFLFSSTREMSFSSLRTLSDVPQTIDDPVQYLQGSIKSFVEAHLVRCLNQCWLINTNQQIERDFCRSEEILAGVQSYFHRVNQSLPINVMTHSLDQQDRFLLSSRSNEHSPKHRHSSLIPSNHEQINSYRSYPHLSVNTHAADSTIVPTTPVDPSMTNLSLISSTTSTSDSSQQYFQKSTSMRFAKLIDHPTNGIRTNSTIPEETKFQLYKDRTSTQVKVPLATPEIVEFNEYLTTNPISSSNESSSDERISTGLQRKVSDRKIKRIRAKQNDVTESASSNEILKKPTSDDDVLLDDEDKQNQKKKRRPSSKRRKKFFNDQTQTDSGIDSRMDSKDSNKIILTSSSNLIVSNEEDSSVGDGAKDSKNTSIEELEERPAGNWIRRQLQYFAQARRDKSRSSAIVNVCSPPFPSTKLSVSTTSTISPLTSVENSSHHVPQRFILSRCPLDDETGVPIFIIKCIRFIEENGLTIEGLYRISGYKNQVELVIHKLNSDPLCDLNSLQIPASAVATALKDMMRKLDEPILSLEQFNECQTFTIEQLREQEFRVLQKALRRTTDLKYRTSNVIFKHLHFVAQHAASTHMDSSNLAVLWWPNLFQPQFHDLRTAEQICQKAKPLIQTIIDHYPLIFSIEQSKTNH